MSSTDVDDAEVGELIERSSKLPPNRNAGLWCMGGELIEVCQEIEKDIDDDITFLHLLERGNVRHDLVIKILCSVCTANVPLFQGSNWELLWTLGMGNQTDHMVYSRDSRCHRSQLVQSLGISTPSNLSEQWNSTSDSDRDLQWYR